LGVDSEGLRIVFFLFAIAAACGEWGLGLILSILFASHLSSWTAFFEQPASEIHEDQRRKAGFLFLELPKGAGHCKEALRVEVSPSRKMARFSNQIKSHPLEFSC
jgi:ABC-type lipoprotein release transport system permease subunit